MPRKTSRNSPTTSSRFDLRPLAGLVASVLSASTLFGQSQQFPTYSTGPQSNGSWVVSSGQIVTPAGKQVDLGIRVRAKAIALNPNKKNHTAAVLTMGASQAVEVIDIKTGDVLQNYIPFGRDSSGSYSGITYSPDGKYLVFSQDSSNVTIANVSKEGLLEDNAQVKVPANSSFIDCFANSPAGDGVPCGTFWTAGTSYPGGVAVSLDSKTAYALLNQNNTLTKIDLTAATPTQGEQIRVGNAPHSIVISSDGSTAYISNEGGRAATDGDFQIYSAGTEVVADPQVGASITGTVSVVNLKKMKVSATIQTGLHPTGMAFYGNNLLVSNTYSDTISVIDMDTNQVDRTIDLGLPIKLPGRKDSIYGAAPNSIAVDAKNGIAYVALYNANAIGVINLARGVNPVMGMIPVAYAPSSVVLDEAQKVLVVANDKGIGARNSFETDFGVTDYNTHQDNGTVSIVPVPNDQKLETMTKKVFENNHWDLTENIKAASGGSQDATPKAIPNKIGDPSLIKHVFLIIRENRTYDQILGDVAAGDGDHTLAVFGGKDTPNVHALVKRFPLFDNFYDPSRQSADGHQWITEGMAPYSDDIQSPDWVRSYPGGGAGDALAYQNKGFLFSEAAAKGLPVKIFGEYVENDTYKQPNGSTSEPSWTQFYADSQKFEAGLEKTLYYGNSIQAYSSLPAVADHLVTNFPLFDLGIPDQFRVDVWLQDFKKDEAAGTVPALSILWVMCDHTGGPPTADAEQADNDLAVGRIVDYVSHSKVWESSAIFVEEDDAQNGVDHVDGHRSPGYVISPYTIQNGPTDHTYYTQVNMTRTIEQILGLPPMNQFDLVASPMRTAFVEGQASPENFKPWTHEPNQVPLNQGVTTSTASNITDSTSVKALRAAWMKKKAQIFAGKLTKPDAEDPDTVNHLNWYQSTGFMRPYPGEKTVRSPSDFKKGAPTTADLD
ncbi:bifunctional YncE family protein/alkaline phosphatase family protein [Tunturiibacter gelidoferens]|jgi:YVTN family beta-propeller protein|uniref:YVTN family beta-propeller protein n=1 Tax=Tunturiibacter gelidiferens TaxID=3069689 RepID=A0A9X0QKB5_9BACT|nr:bifunctional YncE family protein/alkaline phosphatase family protein [Edaphobacter lichenicola]MBB5331709.1 YVTN family beta-propeller protein [Edaphobacter lichenicola]